MAPRRSVARLAWVLLASLLWTVALPADVLHVPGEYPTIQQALNAAGPGDTVEVAAGVYFEKLEFPASGVAGQPISLVATAGARPVIDGTGVGGQNMVLIESKSHVAVIGFEIRNNLGVNDGSGVRITGSGDGIEIRDNHIHDILGEHAMGITVYGTEDPAPIQNLTISGNEITDCEPAQSEALTLNGNVTDFVVENNLVRDVNNIGIDFIGGETDIQPNSTLVARNGLVRGNTVIRANSDYGGGFAGGIYVDGGRDIVIENNWVSESDLGLEVGAENAGLTTRGIVVRNNVLSFNERAGLVFGGYAQSVGRAEENTFRGNTLYKNNTVGEAGQGIHFQGGGVAEIWIQWGSDNVLENNLVVAGPENIFIGSYEASSSVGNTLDHDLYFSHDPQAGEFSLNGAAFQGLAAWRAGTGQDTNSQDVDPLLADGDGGDFHLSAGSPAVGAGRPDFVPAPTERDLDGGTRLVGAAVEIGADELPDTIFTDGFETGDLTAWQ